MKAFILALHTTDEVIRYMSGAVYPVILTHARAVLEYNYNLTSRCLMIGAGPMRITTWLFWEFLRSQNRKKVTLIYQKTRFAEVTIAVLRGIASNLIYFEPNHMTSRATILARWVPWPPPKTVSRVLHDGIWRYEPIICLIPLKIRDKIAIFYGQAVVKNPGIAEKYPTRIFNAMLARCLEKTKRSPTIARNPGSLSGIITDRSYGGLLLL